MVNILRSVNLSTRVLLVVLALFVAGIWGLALRVAAVLQTDLENVSSAHLSATVGYIAADIDAKLQFRLDLLNEIAASVTPDILADSAKLQHLLDHRRTSAALFPNGIGVANTEGNYIAEYPPVPGRMGGSIRDGNYFREIMSGAKLAVGSPHMGRFAKRVAVPLAVPLRDASGGVAGVLASAVFPSDPNLFGLLEQTKIGNTGYFLVISPRDEVIVSASDQSRILQPLAAPGVNSLLDRRRQGFEGAAQGMGRSGVDVLSVGRNIKTAGWMVIAAIPTEEAFAPIASIKRQIYLTALLLSLLAMAILYFVLKRQLAPLHQATTAIRRMTEGTAAFAPLPGEGEDEIGRLVQSFNQLVAERSRIEAALAAKTELLRDTFDNMAEGISIADGNLRLAGWNRRFGELLGFPESLLHENTTFADIIRFNALRGEYGPGDPEEQVRSRVELAAQFQPHHFERTRPDGTVLEIRGSPLPGGGFVTTYTDITARKNAEAALQRLNAELEQRVAERTQALEQGNREMQAFSHSISHDLRAPLRAINGFSKIVLAANDGKFDRETMENLARIAAGAERMGRLIDDLLNLSQISRQEMRRRAVNLSQLAREVVGQLAQAHPERSVEVLVAPDMMIDGDQGLIQIVLENLIGNAWKFTARAAAAKIEVGQLERDGETICFVRDNGAGFDMRYAGKLFGVFQRLHTPQEFEGAGIGLSIVQRIVIKHGGRIWAEAKSGQGATLYFTLAQGAQAI